MYIQMLLRYHLTVLFFKVITQLIRKQGCRPCFVHFLQKESFLKDILSVIKCRFFFSASSRKDNTFVYTIIFLTLIESQQKNTKTHTHRHKHEKNHINENISTPFLSSAHRCKQSLQKNVYRDFLESKTNSPFNLALAETWVF